jgi:glycosyltransferase involved in cell wall biosynthesis
LKKNRIIYFTKYTKKGPSSRYRSYFYFDFLCDEFDIVFHPLFNDEYILDLYIHHTRNYSKVFIAYLKRIYSVLLCLWTKDILFIEYELLPYFPPILEKLLKLTGVRYILDFDDAVFHNYDLNSNFIIRYLLHNKIPEIAKDSSFIITGSPYLTSVLSKYNENIFEIPTSIIYNDYTANINFSEHIDSNITIGWIGSKSTSNNLIFIKELFEICSIKFPNVTFRIMGFDSSLSDLLNFQNVVFYEWKESEEFQFLSSIDIGIMPLMDTPWNKGKCGFKLIQYMAMGKPTISSPFEAHIKINRTNKNLFADSISDWVESIEQFLNNLDACSKIGFQNREIVREFYSMESNYILYKKIFNRIFTDVRY